MTEQHATHPLIAAYLQELDSLLAGVSPGERAEVLAGVREHIGGALAGRPEPSSADAQRVLAELGPPEAVADEAYAGLPAAGPPSPPQRRSALEQPWVPVVVLVLLGLAMVLTAFTAGGVNGYSSSGTSTTSADGTVTVTEESLISYDIGFPVSTLLILFSSAFFWIPATVLVWISPLWTQRERLHLSLLVPALAALLTLLPGLGWLLTRAEIGINVGAWVGLAAGLGGGGWLLWRHTRVARQRAAA